MYSSDSQGIRAELRRRLDPNMSLYESLKAIDTYAQELMDEGIPPEDAMEINRLGRYHTFRLYEAEESELTIEFAMTALYMQVERKIKRQKQD